MYQWRETKIDVVGQESVYSYEGVWSDKKIDSSTFSSDASEMHQNPSNEWPFRSQSFEATNIALGKFRLRPD